ncbi:MAG: hypothetical protein FWG61_02710, partial [Firmicutes bacterium]|nr:hypothetical protein [Bacillota bacterium]
MITFKNSILIFLTAIILVFLLGANHAALAKLPDWEITVHQNLGLYWVSAVQPAAGDRYDEIKNFGIDYEPKLKAEDDADYSATKSYFPAKDTSFTLKNMSPGDKDNSTITITNEADFPVELELLVGCLKGHEIGHFDDGHVEEVILAQKLDMKTFIDGVELETSPGISFPNNKILTVDSFAGDKYETITVNRITGVDISEKIDLKVGAIIGKRTFPKQLQPGERVRVRIEIELDGPTTGNEFQNKEAQFVWVFTATEMPPGHEPGDDDPDTDGDGDADSDGDTDRRRD